MPKVLQPKGFSLSTEGELSSKQNTQENTVANVMEIITA